MDYNFGGRNNTPSSLFLISPRKSTETRCTVLQATILEV